MAALGKQPTPCLCSRFAFCPFAQRDVCFRSMQQFAQSLSTATGDYLRRPRSTRPTTMWGLASLPSVRLEFSA